MRLDREKIKEDCRITENLVDESLRTPRLHHHYNILKLDLTNELSLLTIKYKKLYKEKWDFYMGKSEKPFHLKVIKTDLHLYTDNDEDLALLVSQVEILKNELIFLDELLKQINQRSFHIRNAIEYLKYAAGN